jgi:hypothetical protein
MGATTRPDTRDLFTISRIGLRLPSSRSAPREASRSFRFLRWAGRRSSTMRSAPIRSSLASLSATALHRPRLLSPGCWPSRTTCC